MANQSCQWLQAAQARLQPVARGPRTVRASAPAPRAVPVEERPQPRKTLRTSYGAPSYTVSNVPAGQVSLLACGAGGVEELARQLDDRSVAWALLRFQVGGGTFVRTKMVLIQFNGTRTPALQRGLLNARSTEVLRELGEVNASLQVTCSKELTIDHLCERLLPVFSTDHMEYYSLQALKSEYESMVELSQKRAHEPLRAPSIDTPERRPARRSGATARPVRRSACEAARPAEPQREEREISLDQALQEVAQEGFYDWLLLEPGRFCLFAAGSGGFEELQANLSHDRVLFGLLQLSFGVPPGDGRARGLTKHVLIHWVGPGVGAVRRGLWGAKYGEVSALMSSYCSVAFRQEANHANELKLDEIILKLQRLTVVDSVCGDGVAARISLEEYNAARAEDLRRREATRPKPKQAPAPAAPSGPTAPCAEPVEAVQVRPLPDLKTAVCMVRDPKGHLNWALCGLPMRLPPTPCRAQLVTSAM